MPDAKKVSYCKRLIDNLDKTIGGDSWRVHVRGPSSMSPRVIDHNNGKYEVIFLVLESGKYDVEVVLEYSLCDGYKDPPRDWFIKGNSTSNTKQGLGWNWISKKVLNHVNCIPLHKFKELGKGTPCWCPLDGHQHGG